MKYLTMKKKVWLKIKGRQRRDQDEKPETIELMTEGELYYKNKSYYIVYKESEISGMEGTTTTLKIDKDQVSIIRLGSNNSHMVFEKGKRKRNQYSTPYGDLLISMLTKKVDIQYNKEEKPAFIYLDYTLDIQGLQGSENTLEVEIGHQKDVSP